MLPAIGTALRMLMERQKDSPFFDINMLPKRLRRRSRKLDLAVAWHTLVVGVLVFFAVLFFMGIYFSQQSDIQQAQARVDAYPDEVNLSGPALQAQIDSLQTVYVRITKTLNVIDSLLVGSDRWSRALAHTSRATASTGGAWVGNWTPANSGLRLDGYAMSRNQVVQFAERMNATIEEVTFEEIRDYPVFSFTMSVPVRDELPAGGPLPPRARRRLRARSGAPPLRTGPAPRLRARLHVRPLADEDSPPAPTHAPLPMSNDTLNTIVLSVVLLLVTGFGTYMTQKKQPARLERLEQEETALRLRQAEIEELLVEKAGSSERAEDALRRWNSRYKVLPEHLTSPAVVEYLNALSSTGFRKFNVSMGGLARGADYSTLSYSVQGEGYFGSLYQFIWNVENGRGLYRVQNLDVEAITVSEPEPGDGHRPAGGHRPLRDDRPRLLRRGRGDDGAGLHHRRARTTCSPRGRRRRTRSSPSCSTRSRPTRTTSSMSRGDSLVSVIGQMAVFRDELGARPVRVGDQVYLGRISQVDQNEALVVAELNKGGIRERVEISLATGERYRQALGSARLTRINGPVSFPAPPAPGTPEAKRAARTTSAAATPASGASEARPAPTPQARPSDLPVRLPQDQQSLSRPPKVR